MLIEMATLAEISGAIAVIISLIFIGIELRANTKATKATTACAAAAMTSSWYSDIGDNEQSSSLFLHFMENPEGLTPEQRFQATMKLHSMAVNLQNSFYMAREGTLDKEILTYISGAIRTVSRQPGWIWFWEQRGGLFYEDFQEYMNGLVVNGPILSPKLYKQPDEN